MTAFIELDAYALGTADCRCTHCTAAARTAALSAGATANATAKALAARGPAPVRFRHLRHPLVRAAATGALVAVGGTVAGTCATLATASTADALPAPDHPGWDGHRYWFRADGEWRWTSHYSVYLQHVAPSPPAGTGAGGLRQGWDGSRYWFQRRSDGAWRWTTHYDVYLRHTANPPPLPTPTPPAPPTPQPPTVPPVTTPPVTPPPVPPPVVPPVLPPFQPPGTATHPVAVESAVAFATAQLGKPYVWGGNGPNGYDCSGLVQQAFLRAGVQLPRVAADQFWATTPIASGDLRRGDLLFWSTSSRASGIHHVALYLGDGRYIEAPRPGKDVRVSVLSTSYWPTHFGRILR